MRHRVLQSAHPGQPTRDGNGVPLLRLVPWAGARGSEAFGRMDPFLLLDHFGPMVLPPGSDAGFPPHPHKGFQTLTYMIQGAFRHRDSTGGHGLLQPGGAQLMTAGRGIVHEEMPLPEHLEQGGAIEGVQLWINLPRASKGLPPGYLDIPAEAQPWTELPGGRMRVLAGTFEGIRGPAGTPAAIAYAHLELEPGAEVELALPETWTTAVALLHGDLALGGGALHQGSLGLLGAEGEGVALRALAPASLMVLAGAPLREPIAHYGPFVMNSAAEIQEALADYQAGRLGSLAPA